MVGHLLVVIRIFTPKNYRPPRPIGVKGGCSPQNNRENFVATKRASSRSQQILSEKFNTPDVAKLADEMNDEARAPNDEGNPNDEIRKKAKCSFCHSLRRLRLLR